MCAPVCVLSRPFYMICAVVPMQLLIYVAAEYVDWDRQENVMRGSSDRRKRLIGRLIQAERFNHNSVLRSARSNQLQSARSQPLLATMYNILI